MVAELAQPGSNCLLVPVAAESHLYPCQAHAPPAAPRHNAWAPAPLAARLSLLPSWFQGLLASLAFGEVVVVPRRRLPLAPRGHGTVGSSSAGGWLEGAGLPAGAGGSCSHLANSCRAAPQRELPPLPLPRRHCPALPGQAVGLGVHGDGGNPGISVAGG